MVNAYRKTVGIRRVLLVKIHMVAAGHHFAHVLATFQLQKIAEHNRGFLQMKGILRSDDEMEFAE
jgi:hypothetical protein